MREEDLLHLLKIGRTETLQLIKRDFLTAMLDGKMLESKYIIYEKKINAEIYKRLDKK